MTEESIIQINRRCKERTGELLDDESFNVAEARGKLAKVADFICLDKGVMKVVRSCLDGIPKKEFDEFLEFNDSQLQANTILQIYFWEKHGRQPFYRPKLFYNKPDQKISDKLKELVK